MICYQENKRRPPVLPCQPGQFWAAVNSAETMWKIVGLVLTIGSTIGGLVGFLIHLLLKVNP